MEQQGKARLQHGAAQLGVSCRKSSCLAKQQGSSPSLAVLQPSGYTKLKWEPFQFLTQGRKLKNKSFPTSHSASTKAGGLPELVPERAAMWFPTPHTIRANFAASLPSLFGSGAVLQQMPA